MVTVRQGTFVRINPYEIHCNDPEFFDVLYVSSTKRRTNKWIWAIRQSYEIFCTEHRILRDPRENVLTAG